MIRTILLDLDGTLLEGKLRHYQCYSDILNTHGYKPMPINVYWEMKRFRRSRKEQLAVSGAESIYDIFLDEWLKQIEEPEYLVLDRVQDGVLIKLQEWLDDNIKIILVTMRKSRIHLLNQLKNNELMPYFSSIIVCDHAEGGVGKALKVLYEVPKIKSSSSLWVGDTEADLEGARHLNCPSWLVSNGLRTSEFLDSLKPNFLSESIIDVDLNKVNACVI